MGDKDEDEGMGTSGEIRRRELDEAQRLAKQKEQELERLREAARRREEAERQRRDREK